MEDGGLSEWLRRLPEPPNLTLDCQLGSFFLFSMILILWISLLLVFGSIVTPSVRTVHGRVLLESSFSGCPGRRLCGDFKGRLSKKGWIIGCSSLQDSVFTSVKWSLENLHSHTGTLDRCEQDCTDDIFHQHDILSSERQRNFVHRNFTQARRFEFTMPIDCLLGFLTYDT